MMTVNVNCGSYRRRHLSFRHANFKKCVSEHSGYSTTISTLSHDDRAWINFTKSKCVILSHFQFQHREEKERERHHSQRTFIHKISFGLVKIRVSLAISFAKVLYISCDYVVNEMLYAFGHSPFISMLHGIYICMIFFSIYSGRNYLSNLAVGSIQWTFSASEI